MSTPIALDEPARALVLGVGNVAQSVFESAQGQARLRDLLGQGAHSPQASVGLLLQLGEVGASDALLGFGLAQPRLELAQAELGIEG